ncbi:MAG: hypothetical protein ACOX2O_02730 [Bdellovibrionota bacterium]|jgi:hypothetical protein
MALDLVDFKSNNWFLPVVVIVIVLAIIFVPDFIGSDIDEAGDFDSDLGEQVITLDGLSETKEDLRKTKKVKTKKKEKEAKGGVVGVVDQLPITDGSISSDKKLTQYSYLIDSGHVEETATEQSEKKLKQSGKSTAKDSAKARRGLQPLIPMESVSWELLKGEDVAEILGNARVAARDLANSLSARYVASKYSLYNFIGGIDVILSGGKKNLSALDAVLYLEYLDMEVTRAFIRERVGRERFSEWAEISITPILGRSAAERFKLAARPQYQPPLELRSVEILVPANVRQSRRNQQSGRRGAKEKAALRFKGVLEGKDIVRISVYHNGVLLRDLSLKPLNKEKTAFNFELRKGPVEGLYTLRVENKNGDVATKLYRFSHAYNLRRWRYDANRSQFVFWIAATKSSKHRVDTLFKVSEDSLEKKSSGGFITSGDNSGFVEY